MCPPYRWYSFWWHPRAKGQADPPGSLHHLHHSGWCRHTLCHHLLVLQYHLQKEKVSKQTTCPISVCTILILIFFIYPSSKPIFIPIPSILIQIPPSSFQYLPFSFKYHHLYSNTTILIPIPPFSFQYYHSHSNTTHYHSTLMLWGQLSQSLFVMSSTYCRYTFHRARVGYKGMFRRLLK